MSDYLGQIFKSGEAVPETGTYQLVNDDPDLNDRRNMGRVFNFKHGEDLPDHPDTGGSADWRYVRVSAARRDPKPLIVSKDEVPKE
jgi:hypothetical protein